MFNPLSSAKTSPLGSPNFGLARISICHFPSVRKSIMTKPLKDPRWDSPSAAKIPSSTKRNWFNWYSEVLYQECAIGWKPPKFSSKSPTVIARKPPVIDALLSLWQLNQWFFDESSIFFLGPSKPEKSPEKRAIALSPVLQDSKFTRLGCDSPSFKTALEFPEGTSNYFV